MNSLEIKEFRKKNNLSQSDLSNLTGVSLRTVKSWEYGERNISASAIKIINNYKNNDINKTLNNKSFKEKENNLVPLYDDVSTFGGNVSTDLQAVSNPTEYINAGSWFGQTKITSAIRHYGDSMIEYPNGCILALKDINDFDNVVFGRNYVVETDEIRVTKRIQSGKTEEYITAYSTNKETYPDGRQIHEPFPIKKNKIRKISLVIGRIVKEHSSGDVITI